MDPALIVELVILVIKILLLIFNKNPATVARILRRRSRHPVLKSLFTNPHLFKRPLSSAEQDALAAALAGKTEEDIIAIMKDM